MDRNEDEPNLPTTTPYESPMYSYGSIVAQLTNPEDLLKHLELTYRSQEIDASGNVKPVGAPMMNDMGINSIIGQVRSLVNQVTVLSNLDKQSITGLMTFANRTITVDLMMTRKAYEIKTTTTRDRIHFMALSTAYICMRRPFEEGERRFLKGSVQEIRSTIESSGKRGGFLSGMLGWGKRR